MNRTSDIGFQIRSKRRKANTDVVVSKQLNLIRRVIVMDAARYARKLNFENPRTVGRTPQILRPYLNSKEFKAIPKITEPVRQQINKDVAPLRKQIHDVLSRYAAYREQQDTKFKEKHAKALADLALKDNRAIRGLIRAGVLTAAGGVDNYLQQLQHNARVRRQAHNRIVDLATGFIGSTTSGLLSRGGSTLSSLIGSGLGVGINAYLRQPEGMELNIPGLQNLTRQGLRVYDTLKTRQERTEHIDKIRDEGAYKSLSEFMFKLPAQGKRASQSGLFRAMRHIHEHQLSQERWMVANINEQRENDVLMHIIAACVFGEQYAKLNLPAIFPMEQRFVLSLYLKISLKAHYSLMGRTLKSLLPFEKKCVDALVKTVIQQYVTSHVFGVALPSGTQFIVQDVDAMTNVWLASVIAAFFAGSKAGLPEYLHNILGQMLFNWIAVIYPYSVIEEGNNRFQSNIMQANEMETIFYREWRAQLEKDRPIFMTVRNAIIKASRGEAPGGLLGDMEKLYQDPRFVQDGEEASQAAYLMKKPIVEKILSLL
jgi:hypothetical protein